MKWPLDEKPILVFWETTKACLLACKHCRANAILEGLPGELNTEEAYRLLEDLAGFGRPSPILVFTGGDPLMRSDIWLLIERAVELGLRVSVAPSATPLLTRDAVARMARLGVTAASISIDSPVESIHDSIRGVEGTWRRSVEAVKWMQDEGIAVQVNTVVMRDTVEGLPGMVKLLDDLGVHTWEIFYYVPTGRAGFESDLEPWEYEDVSLFLYDVTRYGFTVRTVEGPFYRRVALSRIMEEMGYKAAGPAPGPLYERLRGELYRLMGEPRGEPRVHVTPTMDGRGIVFISYDGKVYPSGFLPVPAGSVRSRSIVEIYRESTLFRMLRRNLKGRCGRCELNTVCGGSRARAYAYTGDPFAEDPACAYEPGSIPRETVEEALLRLRSRGVHGGGVHSK